MKSSSSKKDRAEDATSPCETARYIAELSDGMSLLARRAGLDVVAYLLDLARLEAEETVERDGSV